jgi:hypothetical protein
LNGKTAHARETLLDTLLPSAPGGDVTSVCRCLLHPQVLHKSGTPLEAVLAACEHNKWPCFTFLDPIGRSRELSSVQWPGRIAPEELRAVIEKSDCIVY